MKHGSLFSGIGGFDLAAQWMGWENVFHCEWNKFCQKILKQHFTNSIPYDDITKTDFTIHRGKLDILTGGFPCQPFSVAGKRKGKEDDRFLWHEMLRAIREIQPIWIVAENVLGIVNQGGGVVFEQVCAEMENEGYEVQPFILPACSIGALHKRERTWFIAHSNGNGHRGNNNHREIGCETSKGFEIKKEREWVWDDVRGTFTKRVNSYTDKGRRKERWDEWLTPIEFTQDHQISSEPGIRRGDYGFSNRVDRLASLGNAIQPQVAFEIFKAIEQFDNL